MFDSKLAYLAELLRDIPEEGRCDFYMRFIQATPDGFSPKTQKLLEERKKAVESSSYLTPPIRDTFRSKEEQGTTTTGIYLICTDSMDDCCQFKGYIVGTEEDADRYVEELDKNDPCYDGWTWVKLEKLN